MPRHTPSLSRRRRSKKRVVLVSALLLFVVSILLVVIATNSRQERGVEELLEAAEEARSRGNPFAAIVSLKQAVANAPAEARIRLKLADAYLSASQYAFAYKEALTARDLNAAVADWLPLAWEGVQIVGDFEGFLELTGATSASAPLESARLLAAEGHTLIELGRQQEGLEQLEAAERIQPTAIAEYARAAAADASGNRSEALQYLESCLAIDGGFYRALVLQGTLLLKANRLTSSEATFSRAIQQRPLEVIPVVGRAEVKVRLARFDAAEVDIRRALKLAPTHPQAHYLAAQIDLHRNDPERAMNALQDALRGDPSHPGANFLMGAIRLGRSELEQAQEHLRITQKQSDGGGVGLLKLLALVELYLENYDAVIELIEPNVRDHLNDSLLLSLAAHAHYFSGNPHKSEQYFARLSVLKAEEVSQVDELSEAIGLEPKKGAGRLFTTLSKNPLFQYADARRRVLALAQRRGPAVEAELQEIVDTIAEPQLAEELLAEGYLQMGELNKARDHFRKLLAKDPERISAKLRLAEIAGRSGDRAGMERSMKQLLAEQQGVEALLTVAQARQRVGDRRAALELVQRIWSEQPGELFSGTLLFEQAINQGRGDYAQLIATQVAERNPLSPIAAHLSGSLLLKMGRPQEAVAAFQEARTLAPASAIHLYGVALAQIESGELAAARESLDALEELSPEPKSRATLALAYRIADGDPKAVEEGERLLEQWPADIELLSLMLRLHVSRGELEQALNYASQIAKLGPHPLRLIPFVDTLQQRGESTRALALVDTLLRSYPENRAFLLRRAQLQHAIGRSDQALASYLKLEGLFPGDHVVLNNLAHTLLATDPRRALDYAKRAVQVSPNSAPALDTLGWIHYQLNEPELALARFRQADELLPDHPEILYHLLTLLIDQGALDEARERLGRNADLLPAAQLRELQRRIANP